MRIIIAASLFLSTVLLPAQTVTKGQGATLEARSESSNPLAMSAASDPSTDVSSTQPSRRISTGVKFPKLISGPRLSVSTADFPTNDVAGQHLVVSFKVDENGVPQNLRLVKSVSPSVDSRILSAVSAYRFEPGTLDDQKVAVDVNLVVNFQLR